MPGPCSSVESAASTAAHGGTLCLQRPYWRRRLFQCSQAHDNSMKNCKEVKSRRICKSLIVVMCYSRTLISTNIIYVVLLYNNDTLLL